VQRETATGPLVPGTLLCAIGNSGKHLWTLHGGFDLFLYEHAVAAIRVTAKETSRGLSGTASPMRDAQRRRLRIKGRRPTEELLGAHPRNRLVPRGMIKEARLRRGLISSSLTLILVDGEVLRWVWSREKLSGAAFEQVEAALRRIVGSALLVR
jgi:hypothetical protein